jgi:diacylglycerol kinase family enzyme
MESSLKQPVIYFQTEKIKILNPFEAPMHIDGDPAEMAAEVDIQILKSCFRLIQPV